MADMQRVFPLSIFQLFPGPAGGVADAAIDPNPKDVDSVDTPRSYREDERAVIPFQANAAVKSR
jgi:hypothetical protein